MSFIHGNVYFMHVWIAEGTQTTNSTSAGRPLSCTHPDCLQSGALSSAQWWRHSRRNDGNGRRTLRSCLHLLPIRGLMLKQNPSKTNLKPSVRGKFHETSTKLDPSKSHKIFKHPIKYPLKSRHTLQNPKSLRWWWTSLHRLLTCDQCAQGDSLGRWGQLKGHRLMQGVVAEIEGACAAQQGFKKVFHMIQ